jgi:hypothetical protein
LLVFFLLALNQSFSFNVTLKQNLFFYPFLSSSVFPYFSSVIPSHYASKDHYFFKCFSFHRTSLAVFTILKQPVSSNH